MKLLKKLLKLISGSFRIQIPSIVFLPIMVGYILSYFLFQLHNPLWAVLSGTIVAFLIRIPYYAGFRHAFEDQCYRALEARITALQPGSQDDPLPPLDR